MRRLSPLASALILSIHGSCALAETLALEEVIVTATKRAESLQDVPVAVNAFSADTIQEAGINNAGDLAVMTPSLNANANSSPFTTRLTAGSTSAATTYSWTITSPVGQVRTSWKTRTSTTANC